MTSTDRALQDRLPGLLERMAQSGASLCVRRVPRDCARSAGLWPVEQASGQLSLLCVLLGPVHDMLFALSVDWRWFQGKLRATDTAAYASCCLQPAPDSLLWAVAKSPAGTLCCATIQHSMCMRLTSVTSAAERVRIHLHEPVTGHRLDFVRHWSS